MLTALIGQLEATKLQNESTISELEAALNKMTDKLAWLESERNNLEKQKSSLSQNQQSQLKTFEKVEIILNFNSFLANRDYCHLLITFANSLDPD